MWEVFALVKLCLAAIVIKSQVCVTPDAMCRLRVSGCIGLKLQFQDRIGTQTHGDHQHQSLEVDHSTSPTLGACCFYVVTKSQGAPPRLLNRRSRIDSPLMLDPLAEAD